MNKKTLEDYLEAIFLLEKEKKVVRIKEIAKFMKVSMPTVNSAVNVLKSMGYVYHENYGAVVLTDRGKRKARKTYEKHVLLYKFFHTVLGVAKRKSEKEACMVEHFLSNETIKKLKEFIENVS